MTFTVPDPELQLSRAVIAKVQEKPFSLEVDKKDILLDKKLFGMIVMIYL